MLFALTVNWIGQDIKRMSPQTLETHLKKQNINADLWTAVFETLTSP